MGWSYGKSSEGREIGYAVEAVCDHPECNQKINRGLAYACGGMHEASDIYCERYFCEAHLLCVDINGMAYTLCDDCLRHLKANPEYMENEDGDFLSVPLFDI